MRRNILENLVITGKFDREMAKGRSSVYPSACHNRDKNSGHW